MSRVEHFVPGLPFAEGEIASRLRWPVPSGVAAVYAEAYTEPGDVVLVPYCQGVTVVGDLLRSRRHALALSFDPLLVLLVNACLAPPARREIDAAVARLGDSLKQGVPLRRSIEELYATACPACLRPAVAEYFIWEREPEGLLAKYLRCPGCGWDGQTAAEPADLERLAALPAQGMQFHYVLDRVTPTGPDEGLRGRLSTLLKLYTPRNLSALADLTLRVESLFPDGPLRNALLVLLLDCLDRCSSLAPLPSRAEDPGGAGRSRSGAARSERRLQRPARFIERNVWRTFEVAVDRLQSASAPAAGLAASADALQAAGTASMAYVGHKLVRDLHHTLAPRSLRLILFSPPPLDPAAWSLGYLWGAWLLTQETAEPMLPLFRQRVADPVWYSRVMGGSLRILSGLLRDDGRLVMVLTGQHPSVVEALLFSARRAQLGVASLNQSGDGYCLELVPGAALGPRRASPGGPLAPPSTEPQSVAEAGPPTIEERATQIAVETIRARGEPVGWHALHASIHGTLAREGRLDDLVRSEDAGASPLDLVAEKVSAALEHPSLIRLLGGEPAEALWWLAGSSDLAVPLADRVERETHHVLQETLALTEAGFAQALYQRFAGTQTPEPGLLATCLRSYGHEPSPSYWQLRPEDDPEARRRERLDMIDGIAQLGHRLGVQVSTEPPFDVVWSGLRDPAGRPRRACFLVRWQVLLGEVLSLARDGWDGTPYLVIPGGRSELLSFKLTWNPAWRQAVDDDGWQFIKYRHIRELSARDDVDEYALRTIIGLDPIVERETTQLSLF